MNANVKQQAPGTTCNNWFLGLPCGCTNCQQQMDSALNGICVPDMQFGISQHSVDPQLMSVAGQLPRGQVANGHISTLFSPKGLSVMHGLPQSSPLTTFHGLDNFEMLPMPALAPQESHAHEVNDNNNSKRRKRSDSTNDLVRPRSSSFQTVASTVYPDTFSPDWFNTPGSDVQTASPAVTPFGDLFSQQGIPAGRDVPVPYAIQIGADTTTAGTKAAMSPVVASANASGSKAVPLAPKPKPIPVTNDMSDAEKARLCELNDKIFAERLRIQRAKNNCAAKKSRQRRLDLIASLQEQVSSKQIIIDAQATELASTRVQLRDSQAQVNSLQVHNAELLREKVSTQQDVLSTRGLREENDRLRADYAKMQELVKTMALGQAGNGGISGGMVVPGSPFSMDGGDANL